ncbi:MAG: deoxyribose-phosphate aldolase [Sedimentisphaerales bacterium]|jgi:deoxyribose-phosphate aldolase|nr:deoxyribose-phosphate aldolase [Sedimentisphaerales bacterium]
MLRIDQKTLAAAIEHTLLLPTATGDQIERHCEQAIEYGFHGVCINSRWIDLAADKLQGTGVKAVTVVDFPLGASSTEVKVANVRQAIFEGADEVDMVADLAAIVEGDSKYILAQLRSVMRVCRAMRPSVILKVIIETAALTNEQKRFACRVAQMAGVDFIKTSTGLHPAGGATVEDVALLKSEAPNCKIKASGGISTLEKALAMLEAGADRIGTSSAVQIMQELAGR